jgi:hypothetical protein
MGLKTSEHNFAFEMNTHLHNLNDIKDHWDRHTIIFEMGCNSHECSVVWGGPGICCKINLPFVFLCHMRGLRQEKYRQFLIPPFPHFSRESMSCLIAPLRPSNGLNYTNSPEHVSWVGTYLVHHHVLYSSSWWLLILQTLFYAPQLSIHRVRPLRWDSYFDTLYSLLMLYL